MLFIESYDAKSLDRSSVSMIDKYNSRLNIVGMLLIRLSALIDNLLSLIRDVRNTLGQCKQRVYDNLNQVKEVIDGNDITGAEGTINTIEGALKAGDEAIARAESTLQGVQKEIECNESGTPTQPEGDCGETCNETPPATDKEDGPTYCSYATNTVTESDRTSTSCRVCSYDECAVNLICNEETNIDASDIRPGCSYGTSVTVVPTCNQEIVYELDRTCNERSCAFPGDATPGGILNDCTFLCEHSSDCKEYSMPENCTYTCVDSGCNYTGNDCAYGTICNESCDQSEPEIEACGNCGQGYGCNDWSEYCGEVGGGSTGEGEEGCGDCGDCGNCGEGEGCGDWSEFCGEGEE